MDMSLPTSFDLGIPRVSGLNHSLTIPILPPYPAGLLSRRLGESSNHSRM
jgi:hypothetical protein